MKAFDDIGNACAIAIGVALYGTLAVCAVLFLLPTIAKALFTLVYAIVWTLFFG